jgi:hypothetical protein
MEVIMFCPQCRREYREGFTTCYDCGVPLVLELPPESTLEYVQLVTVFATGHEGLIALARSILDAAAIRYSLKGEGLQDLFALGRVGSGFNPVVGPVEIQVNKDDEAKAKELLAGLKEQS